MTNQKHKLFIDASPLAARNVTGIPHFTAELIRALERHPENGRSFDIVLVITFDKKKNLKRWNYKAVSYKLLPLPARLFNMLWKLNILPNMDLVLGKGIYLFPNYRNWPLMFKKSRSMTYIHDLTYLEYPQFVQPKNLKFLKRNVQRWIKRTDIVLTGSDHTRGEIINLLNVTSTKVLRIYHGVDRSVYYHRSTKEVTEIKAKYDVVGEYLLYVGSLEPRKNILRLIGAYQHLPGKLRNRYALCLVGGGGWLNEDVLDAIATAKRSGFKIIQPNSYVEDADLPALMTGASLLVQPALYEGFGLSPLQAMACGTPTVAADNSSLPEVVGDAALLVNAEDERDIADKIQTALTDSSLRVSMVSKGLKQAEKFSWEASAEALVSCLKKENLPV